MRIKYLFVVFILLIFSCSLDGPDKNNDTVPEAPDTSEAPDGPDGPGVSEINPELVRGEAVIADTEDLAGFELFFNAGIGCEYEIVWENSEEYTADISVSAYNTDRSETYFENSTSGSETITTRDSERVYIALNVTGNSGTFNLKYDLTDGAPPDTWTIMCYLNSSDLISKTNWAFTQAHNSFSTDTDINIVYIINEGMIDVIDQESLDLYGGWKRPFREDFTDTRLYFTNHAGTFRIGGGREFPEITTASDFSANFGDPNTLRKFIEYCKANFPAENYALFIYGHGWGAGGFSYDENFSDDCLHPGEMTAVLNDSHSVDMIAFYSCLMGNVETAYQFRSDRTGFHADYMVASPIYLWINWRLDYILDRINSTGGFNSEPCIFTGGYEEIFSPSEMTASELGLIMTEEYMDAPGKYISISSYDLSRVAAIKEELDELAVLIYDNDLEGPFGALRFEAGHYYERPSNNDEEIKAMNKTPFFELYDFCDLIEENTNDFTQEIIDQALELRDAIDAMIEYSITGDDVDNVQGLSVFFHGGEECYNGNTLWQNHIWYNANDASGFDLENNSYGRLEWCIDGAVEGNDSAENFFEVLDAWYDPDENGPDGGYNGYQF